MSFVGLDPEDIPKKIIYKISVDGSNLGSRNCELVALTPMNLPTNIINPCSYHSIFPLMLYEGKETRKHLKQIISEVAEEMDALEMDATVTTTHNNHHKCTCVWKCCADFFALVKIMRPEKDEMLSNGKKADSCTCSLCGEKRATKKGGWSENVTKNVWESIPTTRLDSCLFKQMGVKDFIFCILHMKVRVMGTLLKYIVRECEQKKTASQTAKAMREIVRTFNITLKGETVKSTGKKNTKAAKISAMQGGQVDKILDSIRANSKAVNERTEEESHLAAKWDAVWTATKIETDKDKRLLPKYKSYFTQFTQLYNLLNSKQDVTQQQLETYQQVVTKLAAEWTTHHGLKSVTPYLHILFKHSYAYLKEYKSLRMWSQEAFEASHKRHKQYYAKTNFGGGKNGDPSSAFLQVLQKLYRRQHLEQKIVMDKSETRSAAQAQARMHKYRARKAKRTRAQAERRARKKKNL